MLMIIIIEGPEDGGRRWLGLTLHATKKTGPGSLQYNNNNNNNNTAKTNKRLQLKVQLGALIMSTDVSELRG
jgi:hypothetical protein